MKATISSLVEFGRLKNRQAAKSLAKILSQFEGKEIDITVQRHRKPRSKEQNRYYWAIVGVARNAINEAGNTLSAQEVHDYFRGEYLREEIHVGEGNLIERIKSTTELSTLEMNEYIERIRQFCAEMFGVYIPDPEEQISLSL